MRERDHPRAAGPVPAVQPVLTSPRLYLDLPFSKKTSPTFIASLLVWRCQSFNCLARLQRRRGRSSAGIYTVCIGVRQSSRPSSSPWLHKSEKGIKESHISLTQLKSCLKNATGHTWKRYKEFIDLDTCTVRLIIYSKLGIILGIILRPQPQRQPGGRPPPPPQYAASPVPRCKP